MQTVQTFDDLLNSIPWSVHTGFLVAFFGGLFIWAFGRRILRPMLILSGLLFGALAGFVAGGLISQDISIWWPVGIGACVCGLVALGAYRFVMGFLLAVSLGLAAPLGYFTVAELTGVYAGQPGSPVSDHDLIIPSLKQHAEKLDKAADEYLKTRDAIEKTEGKITGSEDQKEPEWRAKWDKVLNFVLTSAAQNWKDAPGREKVITVLSCVGGLAAGIILGILMPQTAGGVVCALFGSLVFLTSGYWLGTRMIPHFDAVLPKSAAAALAWWLSATVIGLVIQFSLGHKKADKPT